MRYAILVLVVVAGCAQRGEVENALDLRISDEALTEWAEQGNPVGFCADEMDSLKVVYREHKIAKMWCGVSDAICGCFMPGAHTIVIVTDMPKGCMPEANVLRHELRHWLSQCSLGYEDADIDHNDSKVWFKSEKLGDVKG